MIQDFPQNEEMVKRRKRNIFIGFSAFSLIILTLTVTLILCYEAELKNWKNQKFATTSYRNYRQNHKLNKKTEKYRNEIFIRYRLEKLHKARNITWSPSMEKISDQALHKTKSKDPVFRNGIMNEFETRFEGISKLASDYNNSLSKVLEGFTPTEVSCSFNLSDNDQIHIICFYK